MIIREEYTQTSVKSTHEPQGLCHWIIMVSRGLVPDHEQHNQKHNEHANRRSPGPVNGRGIPTTAEECRNPVSVGRGEPPYDQDQHHGRRHDQDWIYLARHLHQISLFWKQNWHHKNHGHYSYQEKNIGRRRRIWRWMCSSRGSRFEPRLDPWTIFYQIRITYR